jgi:hypothetical protein
MTFSLPSFGDNEEGLYGERPNGAEEQQGTVDNKALFQRSAVQ